jgi:hypothetical protein
MAKDRPRRQTKRRSGRHSAAEQIARRMRGKDPSRPRKDIPEGHKTAQGPQTLTAVRDKTSAPAADEFEPKPVHFRLLEAYEVAFQDGKNPSDAVIASMLRVRRETITRWRRRNYALRRWVYQQIGVRAEELRPLVDRRVTALAISGSPEHIKLFYQFVAKVGTPSDGEATAATCGFTLNLLIPRPPDPLPPTQIQGASLPAAPALLPRVPTLRVSGG